MLNLKIFVLTQGPSKVFSGLLRFGDVLFNLLFILKNEIKQICYQKKFISYLIKKTYFNYKKLFFYSIILMQKVFFYDFMQYWFFFCVLFQSKQIFKKGDSFLIFLHNMPGVFKLYFLWLLCFGLPDPDLQPGIFIQILFSQQLNMNVILTLDVTKWMCYVRSFISVFFFNEFSCIRFVFFKILSKENVNGKLFFSKNLQITSFNSRTIDRECSHQV